MKLQSIVYPSLKDLDISELYIKKDGNIKIESYNRVHIEATGILDTGTYFNSFSHKKWFEYTTVRQVRLKGKLKGECSLEIYERIIEKGNIEESCIRQYEHSSDQENIIDLEIMPKNSNSMCYIKIRANTDTIVSGMHYWADEQADDQIKIAATICTYKREPYIKRNMDIIKDRIFNNKESVLQNHFDIIIVDNGQTLDTGFEEMQLIKNRNTGGTGGFTRGIMEVLHQKDVKKYTHILLMDDDVDIEPESFERMYSMICLLKDCYKKSFIGGAMLRRDEPCIQEEAGATWNGILHPKGRDFDLREVVNILKNDEIYPVDYNAWWYCCIPVSEIGLNNLPLPFFIHCDDMEYGLRNAKNWILLNGICVWHEVATARKNIVRDYYDVRNFMVLNILYDKKGYSRWQLTKALIRRLAAGLLLPKLSFSVRINAMKDFFRGVEWWEKQEIDILHQSVNSEKGRAKVTDIVSVCVTVLFFPLLYDKYYNNYHKRWRSLAEEEYWNKYQLPPSKE